MFNHRRHVSVRLFPFLFLLTLFCFLLSLAHLKAGQNDVDRERLEDAIRQAAVACYAAEGVYPQDLTTLITDWGIQIDRKHYVVYYDAFAENLMPEITVLNR